MIDARGLVPQGQPATALFGQDLPAVVGRLRRDEALLLELLVARLLVPELGQRRLLALDSVLREGRALPKGSSVCRS